MREPLLHLDVAAPAQEGFDAVAAAELVHRNRNLLTIVQVLANRTLLSASDLDEARTSLTARLRGLARSHELLELDRWQRTPIAAIAERTLYDLGADPDALLMAGPEVVLIPSDARWLSMAFYELATNALKYGALSRPGGIVLVRWWARDTATNRIRLEWSERGGPPAAPPTREGFGTGLIRLSLEAALGGRARTVISTEGIDWMAGDDPRAG